MASMFQKLLTMGGRQVAKRGSTAAKTTEELLEEAPEVIGKGTSRATKEASEEIPEAVYKEITPTTGMDDMSAWSRLDKKKAAALLGLTGAGGLMLSGGDEEIQAPLVPQEPIKAEEPILPKNYMDLAKAEADEMGKTVKTEPASPEGLDFDALSKKFDEGMASLPKDSQATEEAVDEYQIAKERANRNALFAMLGKAATQIGGGIASLGAGSQVKIDGSGFDDLLKMADRPLTQLQEKQKYDKAKSELDDEKAMRDPNSEISKLVSELAVKTGLIKPGQQVSAMSLKNAGVNLGTLLATIEAGKARKEAAALARDEKIKAKESMLNERQRKFVQGLRKEATTGVLGKQYATYSTGQRMGSALEEFSKNPSGYKDYATLMGGLKSLQGDESVVREAEVRLGMSATSAIDAAYNHLQKLATGRMLTENQRKEMVNTIKTLTDASRTQYMHSVKPILEQAQMEGIDPELILSGSLSGAKAETAPATNNSNGMVKVLPPGGTKPKLIPADKLQEALAAGGTLVK
jgi:hypothetical protein